MRSYSRPPERKDAALSIALSLALNIDVGSSAVGYYVGRLVAISEEMTPLYRLLCWLLFQSLLSLSLRR